MALGGKREGAGRRRLEEEKKKVTKSFRITPTLLTEIEKKYSEKTLSWIIEQALIEYLKKHQEKKMNNKILVRRKKGNGDAGKLDRYTVTQLTIDTFIKMLDTLQKIYFVPRDKVENYFNNGDTTKDIFTSEEWENIKEVCKEDNGLLNGNIYLEKLDLIDLVDGICSFFSCKDWIQNENFKKSEIKYIYKEWYEEFKKNFMDEELEELERVVKFICDEDNYNQDFTISK